MSSNLQFSFMKTFLAAVTILASGTAADAQGMYMLNGRATPSVIPGWVFRPLLACQPPASPGDAYAYQPPVPQPSGAYAYQPPPARALPRAGGRGVRTLPPPPIPGAPFEREPD